MIQLKGKNYQASFDRNTGALCSFCSNGVEQLAMPAANPLVEIRMLGVDRNLHKFTSDTAMKTVVRSKGNMLDAVFSLFPEYPGLTVYVEIVADDEGLSFVTSFDNQTDAFVENYTCPCVSVSDNLQGDGGDSLVFWPSREGHIFEQSAQCWEDAYREYDLFSIYPGPIQMQYMARYANDIGVYFAAHDTTGTPKSFIVCRSNGNLRLDIRPFPCVEPNSSWKQNYPIVMMPMTGDWQDASEIYRAFVENSEFPLPPKLRENPDFPSWALCNPIVALYPPRSIRGSGYMGPNEFFPYVQSIKYLEDLSEDLDSEIVSFLPYWEGSAPWAGPYSWPPFGGENAFLEYVQKMHDKGWRVGVYSSGLNWTDTHLTVTDYDRTQERIDKNLTAVMCRLPSGELAPGDCQTIRTGYRMCAACDVTKEIAYDQFDSMLNAGIDYIQYFDQHHGGVGYICYGDNHGHPACYGKWSVEAMTEIFDHMLKKIRDKSAPAILGCESAAADIHAGKMFINDQRWQGGLRNGRSVPAYSYVLHEYTLNFMGNQAGFDNGISRMENPESMQFAVGYSFITGSLLTAILKSGGELHYDWGMSWLHPGPRQNPLKKLMRDCNAMRRLKEKFMNGGRMLKMLPYEQPGEYRMIRRDGTYLVEGEVLSSRWQSSDGEVVQVFVNHTSHDIEISFDPAYDTAVNSKGEAVWADGKKIIPALSTIAVTFA